MGYPQNKHFWISWLQHIPRKVGTVACLPQLYIDISFSSTQFWTFKNWGHKELKSWDWNSLPFLIYTSQSYFAPGWGTGLDWMHISLLFQTHAVATHTECGLASSYWNKQGCQRYIYNCIIDVQIQWAPFSINDAFTDVVQAHQNLSAFLKIWK